MLDKRPIDLADVLRGALETARPALAQPNHHVDVMIPDGPVAIEGDPTRLQQVIVNVLSNAARYTPPGGQIAVALRCGETAAAVHVKDSGAGIPREQLARIFELFTRGADTPPGGFGIGLAVARTIVEQHGGAIEAHSEGAGRGSEFVVRLPLSR